MPSAITHAIIAEEAAKQLPTAVAAPIERHPAYFFLGAQGPDMFFFAPAANKREGNLGKYLHRNAVYELFAAFLAVLPTLEGELREKATAYCLGYVTHACSDVAFHPFVYRYLEQNGLHKREHQRMENDWDVYFGRKHRGHEAKRYPFPDFSGCADALLPLWKGVTEQLGRTPMSEGTLRQGIGNFSRYLAFFHRKSCYNSHRRWARFDRLFHAHTLSPFFPGDTPDEKIIRGEAFERAANADSALPAVQSADGLFARALSDSVYKMMLFSDALGGAALPVEQFDRHLLTGAHTSPSN